MDSVTPKATLNYGEQPQEISINEDTPLEQTDPIKFKNPQAVSINADKIVYLSNVGMLNDVFRSSLVSKLAKVGTIFKLVIKQRKTKIFNITLISENKTFIEDLIKLKEVHLMDETYNWKFTFSKQTNFNLNTKGDFFKIAPNK